MIITPEEKRLIAYHEAGHATVGWILEYAKSLIKVTVIPRWSGAFGAAISARRAAEYSRGNR